MTGNGTGSRRPTDPMWDGMRCSCAGSTVEDYLLQYNPYMGGGVCQYSYKLFYLQDGREVVVQESEVDFDIIFKVFSSIS